MVPTIRTKYLNCGDRLFVMSEWMNASQAGSASSAQHNLPPFDHNLTFTAQNYDFSAINTQDHPYTAPDPSHYSFGSWATQPTPIPTSQTFTNQPTNQYHLPYNYSPRPQPPSQLVPPTVPPSLGPFPTFPQPSPYASPSLAGQLATHVAALDAIGLLQVRLQQLKAVLQSAIHPPGSSLAGTPLGPEHFAKLRTEITNTAARQQALVAQVKQFIAQNGGDSAVQPAVTAFRLQQQRIQQDQANAQIQAALAGAGPAAGSDYPAFPPTFSQFNSNPTPPVHQPLPSHNVSPPTSSRPAPTPLAPLLSGPTGSGPISPPKPPGTPPAGSLPPGLQAAMKARQAAKANAPPPPKPLLKKKPFTAITSDPPTAAPNLPALDSRTIAGLPRSRGTSLSTSANCRSAAGPRTGGKSATARLAEAVPGLPTLTELHKQLRRDQFEVSLKHVLAKQEVEMVDPVKVGGREVSLWDMWQVVMVEGLGGENVDLNSSWAAMASHLGLLSSPSAAAALQAAYHKQLSPYEERWSAALLRQREQMMATRGVSGMIDSGAGDGSSSVGRSDDERARQLEAERTAAMLGQGLWHPVQRLSTPAGPGAGSRFEELTDEDEDDLEAAERRRKDPRRSSVGAPASQGTPLNLPALAPLTAASFDNFPSASDGLSGDALLAMAFGEAGLGGYDLADLGAFGQEGGEPDGAYAYGEGGEALLEGEFDFEQFLAGGGEGEFGREVGYTNWQ